MTQNDIQIGTELTSDVNDEDAEVYGYVDDGEHAVVWAVWETEPDAYIVRVYVCEAGAYENVARFEESGDWCNFETAEELADALASDDPEDALENAREHFGGDR